jgi:hypothetical protein
MLRSAFESLNNGMSGYIVSEDTLNAAFEDLKIAVTNPLLPVYEIEEPLSVLSGRLEARLYENLCEEIAQFKDSCENHMKQ